jgi:hypothetical protein
MKSLILGILILIFHGAGVPSLAQDEYQVKAAFLYNLPRFIEWPASATSGKSISIGIIGSGASADALESFCKGKALDGKPVLTRRMRWDDELRGLHIVFVSDLESKKVQRVLEAASLVGALTVGDLEGFAEEGGVVNFFVADAKVRIEINTESASRAGFKISAKLLGLAKLVSTLPAARKP